MSSSWFGGNRGVVLTGSGLADGPGSRWWPACATGCRRAWNSCSHGFGLDDAIRLALALDRMPGRLVVHAIEAADLGQGTGLSPLVAAAVDEVASAVLGDLRGAGSPA
jgi:Hydrogenase maturation protease